MENDPRNDPYSGYRPDLDRFPDIKSQEEIDDEEDRWITPMQMMILACLAGAIIWVYIVRWIIHLFS